MREKWYDVMVVSNYVGKQVDAQFGKNSEEKEKLQTVNFIPVCWNGTKPFFSYLSTGFPQTFCKW